MGKKLLLFLIIMILIGCQVKEDKIEPVWSNEVLQLAEKNNLKSETFDIPVPYDDMVLVDLDDEYVYLSQWDNDGRHYYRMKRDTQDIEHLYTVHSNIVTSEYVNYGSLLLSFPTDKGGQVVLIDPDKKEHVLFETELSYYIRIIMADEKNVIIYNCNSQKTNDHLSHEKMQVIQFDLKTDQQNILLQLESVYDETENTYSGYICGDIGCIDDEGFVYSLEKMDHESLGEDNSGNRDTSIWYYNLETNQSEKLFDYGYSVDKIQGNKEMIAIHDYRVSSEPVKTNKVAILKENQYVIYTLDKADDYHMTYVDDYYICFKDDGVIQVFDFIQKNYYEYQLIDDNNEHLLEYHQCLYKVMNKDHRIMITKYFIEEGI